MSEEQRPNRFGADWAILRTRNLRQIEEWRRELESLVVAPDRAHQLRGMIHALREQANFVDPTPDPQVKDVSYG